MSVFQYTIFGVSKWFRLDIASMGVLISVQSFGMLLAPLAIGGQSVRIGKKKVLLIAYLLFVTGALIAGFTHNLPVFIIALFVIGAGFSVMEATLSAVLADEFPQNAARHLNFSQVGFSAGALFGPVMAERLLHSGVFIKDFYTYSGMLFLCLGIVFIFTKQKNDVPDQSSRGYRDIVSLLRNRTFLVLALCLFVYIGMETAAPNFGDSYFELVVFAPELSATALSLFWGAMIPSRFLAGAINIDGKKLMPIFLGISILAIVIGMTMQGNTAQLAMFAICGFGFGPLWPLLMNEAAKNNPGSSGLQMNIMVVFGALGGALYPLISGELADLFSPAVVYYLCAASAFIVLGLCFRYSRLVKKAQ